MSMFHTFTVRQSSPEDFPVGKSLTTCETSLIVIFIPTCEHSGVSRISLRGGGGSKFFWKSGGICMARSVMQRVAKPRVC